MTAALSLEPEFTSGRYRRYDPETVKVSEVNIILVNMVIISALLTCRYTCNTRRMSARERPERMYLLNRERSSI